jgi:hypothetical protein
MALSRPLFIACLLCLWAAVTRGQENAIVFSIDTNPDGGLIYLLLVIFFGVNFMTPVGKWIYINYLDELVTKAQKHLEKVQKRLSEQFNDASRQASQSMRSSMAG